MKKTYLLLLLPLFFYSLTAHALIRTVEVIDFQFSPTSLNVNVGDTIRWVWGSGAHTTTSTAVPAGAATWNRAINQSSQTFMYRVTVAGTYNYVCTPHAPGMAGSFTATGVSSVPGVVAAEPAFVIKGNIVTDEINIELDLARSAQVTVRLYNPVGRLVRTYYNAPREAGTYQDNYPVGDLPKGLYLLAVGAGNQQTTRRIIVQ